VRRLDLGPGGVRTMLVLGLLAAIKAATLVAMAEALARGIVGVIAADPAAWVPAMQLGLAAAVVRGIVTWVSASVAAHEAIAARVALRARLARRILGGPMPERRVGALTAVGTVGLDALDTYYRQVLPSAVGAAVVPLLVGARILSVDWVSALIIVITVPLVPVFMALIGLHTREHTADASRRLQRLSDHLVDLARGLPVLVGLGRVDAQTRALKDIADEYRSTTMRTLRTAFLSSLALELIATISVALVAVFVGVRLVNDDLSLTVGLIALILAPECYQPFREVGAAFHASQDGVEALRETRAAIDAPAQDPRRTRDGEVGVRDLVVEHAGRDGATVDGLSFVAARGRITLIEGPSGAGKSTVLAALAGVIAPTGGLVTGVDDDRIAWIPQHPHPVGATVADELDLVAPGVDATGILHRLGLAHLVDADPARLSPGELRRLAVARGLVRVEAGASVLIADEPTAHLDAGSAAAVERELAALRGRVTIVVASHEGGVVRLADHRVVLRSSGDGRERDDAPAAPAPQEIDPTVTRSTAGAGRVLATLVRPIGWQLLGAAALGTLATGFAVALTALSGWLIVRASEHPPIMLLTVAIVGVRFFGIGRAALRYAERLVTHDAVLRGISSMRITLWRGLAALGLASRGLATGATALEHLIGTADRVRDLTPRVLMPPAVAVLTTAAVITTTAIIHPPALLPMALCLGVGLVVAPLVTLVADRAASRGLSASRAAVVRWFAAITAAADELRVGGAAPAALERLDALDRDAATHARRAAHALGLGHALVIASALATCVLVLPASADAVAAGTLAATLLAVLVLVPMGLADPFSAHVDAVQQVPALRASLSRLARIAEGAARPRPDTGAGDPEAVGRARPTTAAGRRLELTGLVTGWPTAGRRFGPITASAAPGEWIVLEGPSGAGKSTTLATLLGHIPPAAGTWSLDGVDAADWSTEALRPRIAWCPQEGHLFDSSIRGNLALARDLEDAPTDDELHAALNAAGLGPLVATLPDGLDTRIGPAGDRLSGGERQRLAIARTLLTRAGVVLLDEPTAHLDAATAAELTASLRAALADRIVVLVSHHDDERREADSVARVLSV
jgi:ATP-binding cassette subfamily C protein CydCD